MYNPVSTYRLQFHKDFTFDQLEAMLPYLKSIGIKTLYASPIFTATPGSTHGYDGLDPHEINPEIGTEEQLFALRKSLAAAGIGWLQDIVPNHMAFHHYNKWLMDVLEKGQKSKYANFFDLSWTGKIFEGRIMVPFLGNPLQEVIQNKELKIAYRNQQFVFDYFDALYPLSNISYSRILNQCATLVSTAALQQLIDQLQQLRQVEDPAVYAPEWQELKVQLAALMRDENFADAVQQTLNTINNDPELLKEVSDEQVYQLSYWQRTDSKINFRRFFTVNGLIAVNIHDDAVFDHYHAYIKALVEKGIFNGLRIDHIDGLFDPTRYLEKLQKTMGAETCIVVEKILEPGEPFPKQWAIEGNSGYDFLAIVNNLLTNKKNEERFTTYYNSLVDDDTPVHRQVLEKKAFILTEHMGGELNNLTRLFVQLNLADTQALDALQKDELSLAIGEVLIQCPVYRYYGNSMPLPLEEVTAVRNIIEHIRADKPALSGALDLLEEAMLVKPKENNAEYNANALRFYQRLMQFTGPLMAKGVEDTLMYTYNRFIGHNEVGDSPEAFGMTIAEFHEQMKARQRDWPLSINGTSTHDTKRGEDVRARLNVLTDLPEEWFAAVEQWRSLNADLKVEGTPDANDEYFIYQTLTGVYAMPGEPEDDVQNRLQEYLQKALREAKLNSNWATPNEEYEDTTKAFAMQLLDKDRPFWKHFAAFHQKVAGYGVVNSLVQTLLKFTCPGVPDTYQGTELWDLSLVDPDNRRPVDYKRLQQLMNDIAQQDASEPETLLPHLWSNHFDGRIKLWLTHFLLKLRKKNPLLFAEGEYLPVQVEGRYKDYIIAFARKYKKEVLVVVAPLHIAELCSAQNTDVLNINWQDTTITLPAIATGDAVQLLAGNQPLKSKNIEIQKLFSHVPLAVLHIEEPVALKRSAGILMHITSLPSRFGIGDMGPEARKFAQFLHRTGQKLWQILPLNPTENGQGHSPYSAISSRAGNTLLISPELLAEEGLLSAEDLAQPGLESLDKVDFTGAETVKQQYFDKAWQAFSSGENSAMQNSFDAFCRQEQEWLHDFALYLLLKKKFAGKPWFEWPDAYRLRDAESLQQLQAEHKDLLDKTKWLQFIFLRQWSAFKTFCNGLGIQLFGDLPFYASYDSVDVWQHPDLFAVDETGAMIGVAGVPPDGFSADGQLWGMPVFNWEVLKERKYDWWIERLKKNAQLFDLLRLDHFRAFAAYWQVPAGDTTARNGKWMPGPGDDFFKMVKQHLGNFQLIAEDLGEIDEPVYALRDDYNMPGMKVLQFAFGDDMSTSNYIPHNYTENFLVYTGTHDNNTTKGWYRTDADAAIHQRINDYCGQWIDERNIAEVFIRMAYSSVAKVAIIPVQDILGLDERARMNKPASVTNNWSWRLVPGQISNKTEEDVKRLVALYHR